MNAYLAANGIGFIAAIFLVENRLRRFPRAISDKAYTLTILSIPTGWLSAHVGDALVRRLPIGQAGFVYYWGLIGAGLFFLLLGMRLFDGRIFLHIVNSLIPVLVLTHAIGRVGCALSGCCFGRLIPGLDVRLPVQLVEAVFLGTLGLLLIRRNPHRLPSNLGIYLVSYPTFRFVLEFARGDQRGELLNLATSQLLSIPGFFAGLLLLTHERRISFDRRSEGLLSLKCRR